MRDNILLVHYRFDPIAWLIRLFTHSYWNHTAFIIDDRNIIESKRKGIRINWADAYDNKFLYKTKILKIKNLSIFQEDIILKALLNYPFKKGYLKRLLSFIYLWRRLDKKLPRETCSGFIAECCAKGGIYFCNKKPSYITPEDINSSFVVEEV